MPTNEIEVPLSRFNMELIFMTSIIAKLNTRITLNCSAWKTKKSCSNSIFLDLCNNKLFYDINKKNVKDTFHLPKSSPFLISFIMFIQDNVAIIFVN